MELNPDATLEASLEALNVKKFDLAFAVDPLFHKTSQQFDEGGARGGWAGGGAGGGGRAGLPRGLGVGRRQPAGLLDPAFHGPGTGAAVWQAAGLVLFNVR